MSYPPFVQTQDLEQLLQSLHDSQQQSEACLRALLLRLEQTRPKLYERTRKGDKQASLKLAREAKKLLPFITKRECKNAEDYDERMRVLKFAKEQWEQLLKHPNWTRGALDGAKRILADSRPRHPSQIRWAKEAIRRFTPLAKKDPPDALWHQEDVAGIPGASVEFGKLRLPPNPWENAANKWSDWKDFAARAPLRDLRQTFKSEETKIAVFRRARYFPEQIKASADWIRKLKAAIAKREKGTG